MAIDLEKAKKFLENDYQRREALGVTSEGDGNKYFSIKKDGQSYIRVLAIETFMLGSHWGVLDGKEGRNGKALRCPKAFDNSPCPICQAVLQLSKSEDPYDQKQAEAWQVKIKYPMLVINLEEASDEFVPRLYEAPKSIWQAVLEWCSNPQWGDITSLESGRNVTITREKAKGSKMYTFQPDPNQTSIEIDPNTLPDLKTAFAPESFEDLQYAMTNGILPPKAKEEDKKIKRNFAVATAPATKKPTPYSKGLPAPKVQDEEPEEQDEVETQEVPAPRAVKREPAQRTQPLKPKVAASIQSLVDDAEPEDEADEQPAAPVKPSNQSLRDRLQAAKMATPAARR